MFYFVTREDPLVFFTEKEGYSLLFSRFVLLLLPASWCTVTDTYHSETINFVEQHKRFVSKKRNPDRIGLEIFQEGRSKDFSTLSIVRRRE